MSKPFDMTVTGMDRLHASMGRFVQIARGGSPDGWMEGVRMTAAYVAESLSKRTQMAKPNPKFREAIDIDIEVIGARRGMSRQAIEAAKHAILPLYAEGGRRRRGAGPRGAYVGDRGFTGRDGPYRPDVWISKDPAKNLNGAKPTIRELKKRWAYQYAGLARASWLTMKQQSERVPKMGEFGKKIIAVLHKVSVVWVRPENLSIHFFNRLSYISSATPPSAISEAIAKGSNRARHEMNRQTREALQKAGLS